MTPFLLLLLTVPLAMKPPGVARRTAVRRRLAVAPAPSLQRRVYAVRGAIVAQAQACLDRWQPDETGEDPELGGGGPCDRIAEAMGNVLAGVGINTTDGGQPGDDHAWLIAYTAEEAVGVDIPWRRYETGGGYRWTKIPGVVLHPDDVVIWPIPRADLDLDGEG